MTSKKGKNLKMADLNPNGQSVVMPDTPAIPYSPLLEVNMQPVGTELMSLEECEILYLATNNVANLHYRSQTCALFLLHKALQ
jgi:hypothetical protein